MHRHPFGAAFYRSEEPFALIHTDLMGPVGQMSVSQHKYIMVIIDDYTRYAWVYFLKKKSHASDRLMEFFALVSRQFDAKVKKVRSRSRREFLSNALSAWFKTQGVIHELSIRHTPKQNGVT